jgi:replicative DNA helicase
MTADPHAAASQAAHVSGETRRAEGRVPPNDLDAEAAILSAIFLSRDVLDRVVHVLEAEHFYSDANRKIYEAFVDLTANGRPIDALTTRSWLADHGVLQRVGGAAYIAQIIDAVPAISNVDDYARIIREKWRLRQLIAACQQVSAEGYAPVESVQAFIDQAEQSVYEIARTLESTTVRPIGEVIRTAFHQITEASKRGTRITGVPTGFTKLDELTGGLHAGDLVVVAARPGMGKTAFVLNVAVNVALPKLVESEAAEGGDDGFGGNVRQEPGHGAAIFSLEMPQEQLAARLLCAEARVDLSKIRRNRIDNDDWSRLTKAAGELAKLPVWIDDTSDLSVLELRGKIRRIQSMCAGKDQPKLGLVMVDYLQLMSGNQRAPSREQQISEISRGLKRLAKDLRVPVVALSQLNRAVETRGTKDKRPQLSDLRESGAIEQDADTIVFIYRDEYYERDNPEVAGIAELIVAKQRNGPVGKCKVRFDHGSTRFDNLAAEDYEELGEE